VSICDKIIKIVVSGVQALCSTDNGGMGAMPQWVPAEKARNGGQRRWG